MSDNSLFAVLLRSPWWISFTVMAVFALAATALLPAQYVPFGVMGAFPFLVIGSMAAWRQWHAPSIDRLQENLERVSKQSWQEFSTELEAAFVQDGYQVERLKGPVADFSLVKGGKTTLVAARRWKAVNQGLEPLHALVVARNAAQADACWWVNLGDASNKAQAYAKTAGVRLLGQTELLTMLVNAAKPPR